MSRRSQWREVRKAIVGGRGAVGKTVEEREKIPEKACGLCKNFSENAKEADGRGTCRILKMGSDLKANPPKLVTEGEIGLEPFPLSHNPWMVGIEHGSHSQRTIHSDIPEEGKISAIPGQGKV